MKQLPPSWSNPTLLECSQFVRGVTYTKSDAADQPASGLIPIVRANNIQARRFDFNDLVYVPEHLVSVQQALKVGDVVIATSSGSISVVGKAAQVQLERAMSFGAFCGVLRPSPGINARYFGHFFSSKAYRDAVSDMARGVNINNLKRDHFQAINVPLAPPIEQKRIADKLDTVLTRVDAVNTRLARVAPILKRFRQSVLAAATSGRLTEEWRDQVGLRWEARTVPLGQLGEVVTGNTPSKKTEANFGGDIPFFKPSDLDAGYEVHTASEYLSALGARQARLLPERSVLVTCIGATIGKTGFARRPCSTNQQINAVICGEEVQAEWLYFWMCSPAAQLAIVNNSSATTLPILNKSRFSALEVSVPSRDEQAEIVRRVETLFAFADRLEARLQTAKTATERLTPALLAKAFRGELVPQDPNDEPASELLRRLQQAAPPTSAKRGRKSPA